RPRRDQVLFHNLYLDLFGCGFGPLICTFRDAEADFSDAGLFDDPNGAFRPYFIFDTGDPRFLIGLSLLTISLPKRKRGFDRADGRSGVYPGLEKPRQASRNEWGDSRQSRRWRQFDQPDLI